MIFAVIFAVIFAGRSHANQRALVCNAAGGPEPDQSGTTVAPESHQSLWTDSRLLSVFTQLRSDPGIAFDSQRFILLRIE